MELYEAIKKDLMGLFETLKIPFIILIVIFGVIFLFNVFLTLKHISA